MEENLGLTMSEPRFFYIIMLDNEILKRKIRKELSALRLNEAQEDMIVKELNYLSDLLIEVYVQKTQHNLS